MSLLIIEDNKDLVQVLAEGFAESGYSVERAYTGEEGLEKAKDPECECIILDLMLPGISGLEVLDRLRADGVVTPIIILTAKDSVDDKVEGLNKGADDFLVKPFDFRELLARVRTLLRRNVDLQHHLLHCGPLTMDPVARECRVENDVLPLRRREFDILDLLLRHENQVFTREKIISQVWQKEYDGTSNVVDVHIKYLRDKLREYGLDTIVVTVRGVGYKVSCPECS
ncbi:response regulator transcription factor [Aminobacterium mobile]|uniref:response regulator transcription factor n=1 Tax=Aminobacterium mobile TaxID=81467 RepID=UPI003315C483